MRMLALKKSSHFTSCIGFIPAMIALKMNTSIPLTSMHHFLNDVLILINSVSYLSA